MKAHFDVIFCRNVLIYFNAETQRQLLPRLIGQLTDHGYLMLGHSENVHWLTDVLEPLGATIYQRESASPALQKTWPQLADPLPRTAAAIPIARLGPRRRDPLRHHGNRQ